MKRKSQNLLFDPESKGRKNIEFILTLLFGCLGIFFAYTANKLASDSEFQQNQINCLSEIVEKLESQDSTLAQQLSESQKQTKKISDQLNITEKNHSNDSLALSATFLLPNIYRLAELRGDLLLNPIVDYKMKSIIFDLNSYEQLKELDKKIKDILYNPLILMHEKERKILINISPNIKWFLKVIKEKGDVGDESFTFKNEDSDYVKNSLVEIQKELEAFTWKLTEYINSWSDIVPK